MSARSASVSGSKLFQRSPYNSSMCSAACCSSRRPVNVGAEPERLAALDAGDHLEREIMAADVGQRAASIISRGTRISLERSAVRVARSTACALSGLWFIR